MTAAQEMGIVTAGFGRPAVDMVHAAVVSAAARVSGIPRVPEDDAWRNPDAAALDAGALERIATPTVRVRSIAPPPR
jgi:hypothetical protein